MKWLTPQQHLRRLRIERFLTSFKYIGLSIMIALAIWVLYACLSNENFNDKFNKCLQNHDLNYCNNNIK